MLFSSNVIKILKVNQKQKHHKKWQKKDNLCGVFCFVVFIKYNYFDLVNKMGFK